MWLMVPHFHEFEPTVTLLCKIQDALQKHLDILLYFRLKVVFILLFS